MDEINVQFAGRLNGLRRKILEVRPPGPQKYESDDHEATVTYFELGPGSTEYLSSLIVPKKSEFHASQ